MCDPVPVGGGARWQWRLTSGRPAQYLSRIAASAALVTLNGSVSPRCSVHDVLSLSLREVVDPRGRLLKTADLFVNGRNFLDIIRDTEQPFADAEGHPRIAGKYIGIPWKLAIFPSRHLLGEYPPIVPAGWDQGQLLRCTCGDAGCWPLLARIIVEGATIRWTDFKQPHRGPTSRTSHWRYDALPDLIFDRTAYEAALNPVIESQ